MTVCCTMEVVCLPNAVLTWLTWQYCFLNKCYTDSVLYYGSGMPSKCCINMVRQNCNIVCLTNVVLTVFYYGIVYAFQILHYHGYDTYAIFFV